MAFDITTLVDKLPPLRIPGIHSKDLIGIDMGATSIKIVQLKFQAGKYQLARWSVIPVPVDFEKEPSPEERKGNLTNLLKAYRGSGKSIPKKATIGVSGNAVIVRYVKFQKLTMKELSKTIKAEAEPYIPFNVEEVYIGFYPFRDITEDGKQKMETVLVAAKKDYVNQKIEILEAAGFKPAVVDVDAFALESVLEMGAPPEQKEETILAMNIGHTKTNFVIIEKGISIVVKDSPVSGNSINKAISKTLGVDLRTAEQLKFSYGVFLTPEEKESAKSAEQKEALGVSDAIVAASKDILTEAKKIIQFYVTQGKDKKINRVFICGGVANIRNFIAYIGQDLNLPTAKINPFAGVAGAEAVPEEHHATLAVACGLAMRRTNDLPE